MIGDHQRSGSLSIEKFNPYDLDDTSVIDPNTVYRNNPREKVYNPLRDTRPLAKLIAAQGAQGSSNTDLDKSYM